MAVHFEDLSGEAGLQNLDEYLVTRSYISGYQASRDDLAVYLALEKAPGAKYVNASRWYSHITALLGSSFPGKAAGVKIAGSAATSSSKEIAVPAAAPPTPETAADDAAEAPAAEEDDDDDLDLFGEETEEEKAAAAEREAAKKASGKKKESGKSSVLLDVKPWDDETDMKKLEEAVRSVQAAGLHWGASKLVPVGYGIKKLQIMMTIEDDLVSPDNLIEDYLTAEPCNEYIQSCDIAAFNKICKFSSTDIVLIHVYPQWHQTPALMLERNTSQFPEGMKLVSRFRCIYTRNLILVLFVVFLAEIRGIFLFV